MKRDNHLLQNLIHLTIFLILILTISPAGATEQTLYIGVLAHEGHENETAIEWEPTAQYLTKSIPELTFKVKTLHRNAVQEAIDEHEIDFIVTDPALYVHLEADHSVTRIATLESLWNNEPYTQISAVLFTTSDQSDINNIADIRNKVFATTSDTCFGHIIAKKEMMDKGIDPEKDIADHIYVSSGTKVVTKVVQKEADVGVVRSGVLESMVSKGELDIKNIKILDQKNNEAFPLIHSTALYPEWTFSKTKYVTDDNARSVASALYSIPPDSNAARAARYYSWTIPLNYEPVRDCLKELGLPPYKDYGSFTFMDVVRNYWYVILLIIISITIMAYSLYNIKNKNRLLKEHILEKERVEHQLNERAKETGCLYNISKTMEQAASINEGLEKVTDIIPTGWQYTDITCARITFNEETFQTPNYQDTSWKIQQDMILHQKDGHNQGIIEVCYLENMAFKDEEPFLEEEIKLLGAIAESLGVYIEKKIMEKQLIERNSELENIIRALPTGVVLIDEQNHEIISANPLALEMFGMEKEEIAGKICHKFICPAEKGKCPITDLGQEVDHSERTLIRADRSEMPILKSVVHINLNGKKCLLESFIDISDLKEAQQESLNAKIAAEASNRSKSEFLANMSHELRTPLNSIIGFSEILLDGTFGELNEKQAKYIGNVYDSGKHLLNLINDILDLSKVEAGRMELHYEEVKVHPVFEEIKSIISPLANKKEITLESTIEEGLVTIDTDRGKFKQILFNLVSNAIKFTPDSGKVSINATTNNDMALITVTDTGIGIPEEDQKKLFNPFQQLDASTTREYQGTGLGLALVKKFTQLHGGDVWLESKDGEGSTFGFSIPIKNKDVIESHTQSTTQPSREPTRPEIPAISEEVDTKQIKSKAPHISVPENSDGSEPLILVIEDDPRSRELLTLSLVEAGYRVVAATNGRDGVTMAKVMKPFAITTDIMMPGMDGWDVLNNLRTNEKTSRIPIIIISMVDDRNIGLASGAADYFVKPVDKNTLLDTIENLKSSINTTSPRILIVDDEPDALELMCSIVETAGFKPLRAHGGQEGIDITEKEHPDAIILDLMMPNVSGYDVLTTIKSKTGTKDIPVIICTAKDIISDDMDKLRGKVISVMHKGEFTKEELVEKLKELETEHNESEKH